MKRPARRAGPLALAFLLAAAGASIGAPEALRASRNAPFGHAEAAHLLRRAGFGGNPSQIAYLAALGRDAAVDLLVDYEAIPLGDAPYPHEDEAARPLERRLLADLEENERREVDALVRQLHERHMEDARAWWLRRMVVTARPLEEKMTLFWHGHFTSGFREVRDWHLMVEQNDLFRRHALGDFGDLLLEVSRDGAMLRYLDNARNEKAHPNENYARELLELFALGEGNYTERDIREAARAFTGWGLDPDGFRFYPRRHDSGKKTIFGKRGEFDGDDVIRLLLAHPKSSRHLALRLWEFFVAPDPDEGTVEAVAALVRKHHFELREVMRSILRSDAFYSEGARFAKIKSPVELVVGSVRALEIESVNPSGLYHACRLMGQNLFQPPNVKGWDGERRWITTSTLFARYNFAADLLGAEAGPASRRRRAPGADEEAMRPTLARITPQTVATTPYDPLATLRAAGIASPQAIVRHYVDRLLQREFPQERFEIVLEAFSPADDPFRIDVPDAASRIRNLIRLLMSTPEYQLE